MTSGRLRATTLASAIAALSIPLLPDAHAGSSPSPRETAPCLKRRHFPNYTAYSLGATFAGLPLTDMSRFCFAPPKSPFRIVGPGPRSVAWISEATYGTCTPTGSEGGCGPPLEVQSWPECDRRFWDSPSELTARKSVFLSGSRKIPTAAFEYGLTTRLEMYTGQTTVVIFSAGPDLAVRAAHALARKIELKLSSVSAARLRAIALDRRPCHPR